MLIVLDKVYPMIQTKNRRQNGESSWEFKVGTVTKYISNNETKPANAGEMTPDDASPYDPGCYGPGKVVKWVLWTDASGAPVIYDNGIAKSENI